MSARPKLRADLILVEQTYRGEQSFVVKDPESRKYFRFRPVEITVMQALDGEHTPAEAAAGLQAEGIRVSPAAVEKFAAKLSAMGLCERTLGERSVLLMERLRAERRRRLGKGVFQGDMLRLRWSVGDPDKLLDRWLPRLRFFFSRSFIVLSIVLFALYFLVMGLRWNEFSQALANIYTLKLGVADYAILWVTGTVIIVFHELGHGFTCKYFGGRVHEIGAMLIYFEPAFFCNVNDAWTFPERSARLWVTAAGSWIQFAIAGVAAVVWWAATPGTIVYQVSFAAVLIGGIVTVLLNINPLIPLDGYYALSDYLEVPNLRQRASGHLSWLIKTKVLRLDVPEPPADARERRIFLTYGVLSAIYIALILLFCAANSYGWLSRTLGSLGVLIFLVAAAVVVRRQLQGWGQAAMMAIRKHGPGWKPRLLQRRVLAAGLGLIVIGMLVPWPITVSGPFTVAPGSLVSLTAPDSGVVTRVNVREGVRVEPGASVLQLRNFELERERIALRRVADSLAIAAGRARADGRMDELAHLEAVQAVEAARLAGLEEQVQALRLRAIGPAVVLSSRPEELIGRWVSPGETLLQLGQPDTVELRIALAGAGASAVSVGQTVRLLPDASAHSMRSTLTQVSATADPSHSLEGRVRLAGAGFWRPGMTGRARITLQQSNFWGALWWGIRRTVRSDILL
jgi:putative peptide zinc metalloprotease protein